MDHRMLKDIEPSELKDWLISKKALLVDVRDASEYAREHIAEARLIPLRRIGKTDFSDEQARIGVFHCRTGQRTARAAQALIATGFEEVYHLKGGIEAWKRAGFPTEINPSAPIELLRQVFIAAGSLVLLGVVLATVLSPWFLGVSAFVGTGLIFAGVTGICPMSRLFALMPWNRRAAACILDGARA